MLSPRLKFIYDLMIEHEPVWDLCCDHGYLGIVALKSGRFPQIHFVDQAAHLIEALRVRWGAESNVSFYPHSAENITIPLTGNVILAGVGGLKVLNILQELKGKGLLQAQRLILVPQKDESMVKEQILAQYLDYRLDQSLCVQEGPRVRQVFVLNLKNDIGMDRIPADASLSTS